MDKIERVLLISYVPLMYNGSGLTITPDQIDKLMPDDVDVAACIWLVDIESHQASVVLAIDGAMAVAEHMSWWSENNIGKRFQFITGSDHRAYYVGIVPKLDETYNRHRQNHEILSGQSLADDVNYTIFFKPLSFVAPISDSFKQARSSLLEMTSLDVGLVDVSDIQNINVDGFDFSKIIPLGVLDIASGERWSDLIAASIADVVDDE